MNVAELIEWLKTQDQEAIVEVLTSESVGCHWNVRVETHREAFRPDEHADYMDFRGNPFVSRAQSHYNRRYLFLGNDGGNG